MENAQKLQINSLLPVFDLPYSCCLKWQHVCVEGVFHWIITLFQIQILAHTPASPMANTAELVISRPFLLLFTWAGLPQTSHRDFCACFKRCTSFDTRRWTTAGASGEPLHTYGGTFFLVRWFTALWRYSWACLTFLGWRTHTRISLPPQIFSLALSFYFILKARCLYSFTFASIVKLKPRICPLHMLELVEMDITQTHR